LGFLGTRPYERAYVVFLNSLRADVYKKGHGALSKIYKGGAIPGKELDALAEFINLASGRGKLPKKLAGAGKILNATLFSPRLLMSRLELPKMLFSSQKYTRTQAWQTLGTFLGFGGAALSLYKVLGGRVELDPRSGEFAKMKVGDSRVDVWGGYSQYIRLLAQLMTEERKTASGDFYEINALQSLQRFAQSKASPLGGLVVDLLSGEDYMGRRMDTMEAVPEQLYNRLAPLFLQDMVDSMSQNGFPSGLVAIPAAFGVGVTTYVDPVEKKRNDIARGLGYQSWEELGVKEGKLGQLKVQQANPGLVKLIEKEQEDFAQSLSGKSSVSLQWSQQAKEYEKTYQRDIVRAAVKANRTGDYSAFKDEVNAAARSRRDGYTSLAKNPKFVDYTTKLSIPLTSEKSAKMNPLDIAKHEYNQMMFGTDMYTNEGDYNFDLAAERRKTFIESFGQEAMNYVEESQGVKEVELPQEYHDLKKAREILKPYWGIDSQVWAQYPEGMQELSQKQQALENAGDPVGKKKAMEILRLNPSILKAQGEIAVKKKQLKLLVPEIDAAWRKYYRGG
jgi:hypothetical protein